MRTGLCSITFRQLDPTTILQLCVQQQLDGVEWGGDVHVPHGDLDAARRIGDQTRAAGLAVASYGSYYRAGSTEGPTADDVRRSAEALDAPLVRVWAGTRGSADTPDRQPVVDDLRRLCDAASDRTVALEFHGGTLTDDADSTVDLLRAVDRPNLRTLWQPRNGTATEECIADLRKVRPWLANLHVFHWWPTNETRRPLQEGESRWQAFLQEVPPDPERWALLEFVKNDDPAQLADDAATLRRWVSSPAR